MSNNWPTNYNKCGYPTPYVPNSTAPIINISYDNDNDSGRGDCNCNRGSCNCSKCNHTEHHGKPEKGHTGPIGPP